MPIQLKISLNLSHLIHKYEEYRLFTKLEWGKIKKRSKYKLNTITIQELNNVHLPTIRCNKIKQESELAKLVLQK